MYRCTTCGDEHHELPFSFGFDEPDQYHWLSVDEREERALLSESQCVIDHEHFFLRGCVDIPIVGNQDPFLLGAWVRVSEADFQEVAEHWVEVGREDGDGPYKGRLANSLPVFKPDTFDLEVELIVQPVPNRPLIKIQSPHHLLAKQQKDGITLASAKALSAALLHR